MGNLTAAQLRKINEPGRYGDGAGLYLVVSPGGSRYWIQRIRLDGMRTDKGLGSLTDVSLTEARKKAAANRDALQQGRNPWSEQEQEKAARLEQLKVIPTFRDVTYKVHEANAVRWRNGKHTISWLQTLERHAKLILDMPIDEITQAHVLTVLEPIWSTKPETARRVRQRMRAVFKWGVSWGYIPFNPAGEVIDGALVPMPKVQEHLKALPYQEVPAAIKKIRDSEAWAATKLAFEFMILTAARGGEVRYATWAEIDGDTWTRPAHKMKGNKPHRVPLSIQATVLLRTAKEKLGTESGLIFPSPDGNPLSENALPMRAKKCGIQAVPHGFRSSFRDWAEECSSGSHAAIEISLVHDYGSAVERAYFRSDLLEQRRELNQEWCNFLDPLPF